MNKIIQTPEIQNLATGFRPHPAHTYASVDVALCGCGLFGGAASDGHESAMQWRAFSRHQLALFPADCTAWQLLQETHALAPEVGTQRPFFIGQRMADRLMGNMHSGPMGALFLNAGTTGEERTKGWSASQFSSVDPSGAEKIQTAFGNNSWARKLCA